MNAQLQAMLEQAKVALIDDLVRRQNEVLSAVVRNEDKGDYRMALRYALTVRELQKKRAEVEAQEALQVVMNEADAFASFFERVKEFVHESVNTIYKTLTDMAIRPHQADESKLDAAMRDIEFVISDLQQFVDRYPAALGEYIDYLRNIPKDVEAVLKEIN